EACILLALIVVHVNLITYSRFHLFFFHTYGDHRALHSFPTRRSSDLNAAATPDALPRVLAPGPGSGPQIEAGLPRPQQPRASVRSEEHTSELQSLAYLVCRLLLEKKKSDFENE